uniref:Uncharacterized protein MANES_02G171200 n=1 Tax=Rhizophora mucronata TaxID=61149 RepID=A0A2P2JDE2_RHIMU
MHNCQVLWVRHCRRPCRCIFTIQWICQDLKDGAAVPSSSIMKLAMKSISLHPIISILFESEKSINSSLQSPFSTRFEAINHEMDTIKLLFMKLLLVKFSTMSCFPF